MIRTLLLAALFTGLLAAFRPCAAGTVADRTDTAATARIPADSLRPAARTPEECLPDGKTASANTPDTESAAGTNPAPADAPDTKPAAGTAAAGTANAPAPADTAAYLRPPYLREGDTIAVVSPSGRIVARADTAKVRERLESWGLHVLFGTHYADRSQPYFAGTDAERAADLQRMLDDPSVKAVIAFRGGYGSVRLLPHLDLRRLREHPKWLAGFSDITTLHLVLRRLRIESIHGQMPAGFLFDEGTEDPSAESLREGFQSRFSGGKARLQHRLIHLWNVVVRVIRPCGKVRTDVRQIRTQLFNTAGKCAVVSRLRRFHRFAPLRGDDLHDGFRLRKVHFAV